MRKFFPLLLGISIGLAGLATVGQTQDPAVPADAGAAPADAGMDASAIPAQTDTTGFSGSVKSTDSGSPPISGATVQYTGSEGEGSTTSSATGEFNAEGLVPGTYLLSVSAEGYTPRENVPVTVVSGASTPVEVKLRKKETLASFAAKFGVVGPPLLLCSIGAVTFLIERSIAYSRLNKGNAQLMQDVSDALAKDNVMQAIQACEERGTPLANVLKAGLLRYSQGLVRGEKPAKGDIQEAMQEASILELPEYDRNLTWLSTIAVVAPLFGLLGTVTGMIKSFTVIALEGTNDPNALAGGISEALYTTAAGLFIAAPTLVLYAFFENTINKSTNLIEVASTDVVNALTTAKSK